MKRPYFSHSCCNQTEIGIPVVAQGAARSNLKPFLSLDSLLDCAVDAPEACWRWRA